MTQPVAIALSILLSLAVLAPASAAPTSEAMAVQQAEGDAIIRPIGEYMWRRTRSGDELGAGDRVRVRGGLVRVDLPVASLTVRNEGEFELGAQLTDQGALLPWNHDLRLYIGSYEMEVASQSHASGLLATTLFGEIVSTNAVMSIEETAQGTRVTVVSGAAEIRHRYVSTRPIAAKAGDCVAITSKSLRLEISEPVSAAFRP
jgi:hypothetical protein